MTKSTLLLETIDLLRRTPGVTIDELASALSRSKRTVYRWLNELTTDLRVDIYCKEGGYYLNGAPSRASVQLTPEETVALYLALKSSVFSSGSPLQAYAESAWRKVKESAPEAGPALANLVGTHSVDLTSVSGGPGAAIAESIEKAVNGRERVHALYRSQKSGAVKEYVIDPYAIVFRRHSWYLVGRSEEHGRVVQFKLLRFEQVERTGVVFEPPRDFTVNDYFRNSWEAWGGGEATLVRVRFSPRVAPMIGESRRHPTQVVHPEQDGGVILEVTVGGIEEIAIWIMGFGGDAEVLDPEDLRDYIREHARAMAAVYATPDAREPSPMTQASRPSPC